MKQFLRQPALIMLANFATAMVLYTLARWFFYFMNLDGFQDVTFSDMMRMTLGGFRFDLSALCYINILFVIMQTIPFQFRDTIKYQRIVKWMFLIVNSLGIFVNVADVVYYRFGGRRTTASFFSEFAGEDNIGKILLASVSEYWPVWLFGIGSIVALILLYYNPIKANKRWVDYAHGIIYYPLHTIVFLMLTLLTFVGLRGGWALKMHPLRQDSAELYIRKAAHAPIVLNTPFTIITTIHKSGFKNPQFYESQQLDSIFCPLHQAPDTSGQMNKMNVIVILMEGFSTEYTGYPNSLDSGQYKGYTPFLDSLISVSHHYRYSLANGIRSVDAMPGVFAGIPRYIEPYCYFVYANNTIQGLPEMLENEGYRCAFYHGAPNTTLGFKMFTNSIGFREYYGMDEYENKSEFDGTWAIFDEPYLQHFANEIKTMGKDNKPFLATVFTASSHQPYRVPDQYAGKFPMGDHPMHQAVGYSDYALRRFFDSIKDEPWLKNTIIVFTADHTGPNVRQDFNNGYGRFRIPIFFYTPGGQLDAVCDTTRIMQQTDITPTLLHLLKYQKPYFSFGKNILEQDSAQYINYAFNDLNGSSMYYLDSLMIEYSNNTLSGIYEYRKDPELRNNIMAQKDSISSLPFMESQIKAIIQQYVERMKDNKLTAE
ncbi:MAG: sulfatase-like hydrolase/transferase [Bacteroidales bacterium]|nr:sulfatase-like hydrolase/transferase [Bacteroidales bacterium]